MHPHHPPSAAALATVVLLVLTTPPVTADHELGLHGQVDLATEPVPFLEDTDIPERAGPFIELGRGINAPGKLAPGIEMPTGAIWQPALWVYGFSQTAYTTMFGPQRPMPGQRHEEIATRLNLFANLQLTGTERVLMHVRPLDRNATYTRVAFSPNGQEEHVEDNVDIRLFFAEGEFGEIFPRLDPEDRKRLDIGMSIGLQPLFFQNGILINDPVESLAIAQKSIIFPGTAGARAAFVYGWDNINLGNTSRDKQDQSQLFGLFMEADMPNATLYELDFAHVSADEARRGDQNNLGFSITTHRRAANYSLRANWSNHYNNEKALAQLECQNTAPAPAGGCLGPTTKIKDDYDGALLVFESSRNVSPNHDIVYFNAFRAWDSFAPIARTAETAGPLVIIGIAYAGVSWGAYRPALLPRALQSAGFALGYQKFFDHERANWTIELAARDDLRTDAEIGTMDGNSGAAITTRYQRKFWNRYMWQLDAHYARYDQQYVDGHSGYGVRLELRVNI